jgi:hypothetical protein
VLLFGLTNRGASARAPRSASRNTHLCCWLVGLVRAARRRHPVLSCARIDGRDGDPTSPLTACFASESAASPVFVVCVAHRADGQQQWDDTHWRRRSCERAQNDERALRFNHKRNSISSRLQDRLEDAVIFPFYKSDPNYT